MCTFENLKELEFLIRAETTLIIGSLGMLIILLYAVSFFRK